MQLKKILFVAALCALMSVVAMAADLTGTWVVKQPGRDGATRDVTYTFKVDGKTLTGTAPGRQGAEVAIKDGKVDGDNFEFAVDRQGPDGATISQAYKGKISGDTITITTTMRGNSIEMKGERKKSM
jgi:hypothetical protein